MKDFLTDTVFQRRKDLLSSRMDQETVMMHPDNGKYFSLNPVATRIWEILEVPLTFNEIVKALLNEFDVPVEVCQNETKEFLQILIDKDIIEIKG